MHGSKYNSIKSLPPISVSSLFLPTAIALSLSLMGCSDKPDANKAAETSTESTTSISSDSPTSQTADTRELAEIQELRVNNGTEPESIDPHKTSGLAEANIIRQQLVGLVTTDANGKTIPAMAESWDNVDNKEWMFKLRDAKWSNGDPVTAEDFVYGMRRLVNPDTAAPYASYLGDARVLNAEKIVNGEMPVESLGVEAIDDKTLKITLTESVPYFVDMLFHTSTFPVHKATVEKFGDKWTQPENIVVNGPYKISSWRVNDEIVLTRNPTYFDNANTKINTVKILPISDAKAALARYKAGDIDVAAVPGDLLESMQKEMPGEIIKTGNLCTSYYIYNNEKPPFNDVKVRRAVAIALDRDILTKKVSQRGETPAYQFTPTAMANQKPFVPDWSKLSKDERNAKVKALLAEAGYSDSKPLEFELLYTTNDDNKKLAVATSSLLQNALGSVKVNMVNKEWKTFLATTKSGDFDMARYVWCGDYNEPSTFLNILKTGNSNNIGKYSSPDFDAIMSQTLKAGVTADQRAELYYQAEAILDRDMPQLNMDHSVSVSAYKPYLINWPVNDPLKNWQAKDIAIAKH